MLGLLGPNGAGKTTVVRILSTILRPTPGTATLLGHDVVSEADAVRRLDRPGRPVRHRRREPDRPGEPRAWSGGSRHLPRSGQRAGPTSCSSSSASPTPADRTLKTYSGGMRRRLDLAAALVARPPVLFLDEPTTGLDPQSRQDLWEVIEALVGGGTTVLLTTQYLEEADRLADHIVVIDHGQVIAEGTPAELKADLGTTVLALTLPTREAAARPRAARRPRPARRRPSTARWSS